MIYRETGQLKSSYAADQAIFPIAQDRWLMLGLLLVAFLVVPWLIDDYWVNAILLPFLVYALAAQFFLVWLFNKVGWFYNYDASGQITAPPVSALGQPVTGAGASPAAKYLFCLTFVCLFALVAKNLLRHRIGRSWMAIRDMDIAAEIIGVRPLGAKLSAFAVSSFYVGMAGALYFAVWLGSAEPLEAFGIDRSFLVLFMIITGGLGSVLGAFLGAAFMVLLPILLETVLVDGLGVAVATAKHTETLLLGLLIIFFLIVEPHGLARLWQMLKEKLRLWPFPY